MCIRDSFIAFHPRRHHRGVEQRLKHAAAVFVEVYVCLLYTSFTGFIPVFGIPDNGNEVIHVVQGQQEGFQALGILLRIGQMAHGMVCVMSGNNWPKQPNNMM